MTKNNGRYVDVPDKLKWAIPLHEHVTSPSIMAELKRIETLAIQELSKEKARKKPVNRKKPKLAVT